VKASGGIRDKDTATQMIEAGANRLGTSSGIKICKKNNDEEEEDEDHDDHHQHDTHRFPRNHYAEKY